MSLKTAAYEIAIKVSLPWITVLNILATMLPFIIECMSPEDAVKHFAQDTVSTRAQIRGACRRAWRQEHGNAPMPEELVLEMQQRMKTMPVETMRAIYAEQRK